MVRLGDWLTGAVTGRFRKFQDFKTARAFARGLGLDSSDQWRAFCLSGKKPQNVPAYPNETYAEAGWSGWGDWLGTGTVANSLREYRSFKKARAFVRRRRLKSNREWRNYCRSGKKPENIPTAPDRVYAEAGWTGWGDWLGTGAVASYLRKYRSFKRARSFVRSLGLKSMAEWKAYCGLRKKPADLPSNPNLVYRNDGWVGFGDWLGTGRVADQFRQYRSFKRARAFVRRLGLKSQTHWRDYCRSGKKPDDIPAAPHNTYKKDGWAGMGDWLGTGIVASYLRQYRSFKKARTFVRALGLKSQSEWFAYCKSGKKPDDIPTAASEVYAEAGWAGYGDWLGTGRRRVSAS
jgi:Integrase repeat unit